MQRHQIQLINEQVGLGQLTHRFLQVIAEDIRNQTWYLSETKMEGFGQKNVFFLFIAHMIRA